MVFSGSNITVLLAPWCLLNQGGFATNAEGKAPLDNEQQLYQWFLFLLTNQMALHTPIRLRVLPYDADLNLSVMPGSNKAEEVVRQFNSTYIVVCGYHRASSGSADRVLRFKLLDINQQQLLSQWDFTEGQGLTASTTDEYRFSISQQLSQGFINWLTRCFLSNKHPGVNRPFVQQLESLKKLLEAEALMLDSDALEKRMELYEAVLKTEPEQETALLNLARLKQSQQQYKQAFTYYQQLLKSSAALPSMQAYFANEAGICQAVLKNGELAQKYWTQSLESLPTFILPYLNLAHLLEEEDKLAESESLFLKVQQMDPTDPRTAYSLARIYSKTSRWEEALKQYQYQLDANSDDPWCYSNIANCYLQLQRSREAALHFKMVVKLDPDGEAGQYADFVLTQLENTTV